VENTKNNEMTRTLTLVKNDQDYSKNANSVNYLIKDGDNPEKLAWDFYKNKKMKNVLLSANNITEGQFQPGMMIRVPIVKSANLSGLNIVKKEEPKKQGNILGIIETYNGRGGETLDYLAHVYYREQRFAYIIAVYNQKPLNYELEKGEKILIPFKVVEVKQGETIFQIAERETRLRNYFLNLLMINRKLKPKVGDRLRVPPVSNY